MTTAPLAGLGEKMKTDRILHREYSIDLERNIYSWRIVAILCGQRTANGERLNCAGMTAAHRTLPFGTRVRVCHNRCVVVRINDRGPWVRGRHIDLSPAAARAIGLPQTGRVTMTVGL